MPAAPRRSLSAALPTVVTRGEEGMISLVSLFAALGLLVLFGALANVGRVTTRKLETQNAADATANAGGVEMARGLNSVTTANHLIGELTALCIIHHGFGGDELDKGEYPEDWASKVSVLLAHISALPAYATPVQPVREAYTQAVTTRLTGGAIRDARIQLRYVLTVAFLTHAAGAVLFDTIIFSSIGLALMEAAAATEEKVLIEWKILTVLENCASGTVSFKRTLMSLAIPALHKYTGLVTAATPFQMERAAEEVGLRNGTTGRLFPAPPGARRSPLALLTGKDLELPVEQEPARPRAWQKSQLVRAATPWVQCWRKPWLDFGILSLTLSGFSYYYQERTNKYTKTLTDRLRQNGVRLYKLPGWEPGGTEKGREDWTRNSDPASRRVDQLFCTLGLVHRGPPDVVSYGIYRQTNPDGMAAYAQTIVYGGNPQVPAPGSDYQPRLGWDTLNWSSNVREYPGESLWSVGYPPMVTALYAPGVDEPRITINWQTKLVPTTRLRESLPYQTGPLGTVIRRVNPLDPTLTRTH